MFDDTACNDSTDAAWRAGYARALEDQRAHAERLRQRKYRRANNTVAPDTREQKLASIAEAVRNRHLKRNYGITLEERNARLALQGDRCDVCNSPDPGSRDWHTDHCHSTGKIRGILCRQCNLLLGYAADEVKILASASRYLERNR